MRNEVAARRLFYGRYGQLVVLWEDADRYALERSYSIEIIAFADHLIGYLGEELLFAVRDPDIASGQVGLYACANRGAIFDSLTVESFETQPVLWQPTFADTSEVTIVDETGAVDGPSQWTTSSGTLLQSSNLSVPGETALLPGTYALGGHDSWRDVTISVTLGTVTNTGGAIGVMFRYQDDHNYYRFATDPVAGYRRLIKQVAGVVTTLWEGIVGDASSGDAQLTLQVTGATLRGTLSGQRLFSLQDADLLHGRIGLYTRQNPGARFARALVLDASRRVGTWTVHDSGSLDAPSQWRLGNGAFVQRSAIAGGLDPEAPGTMAIAGDPAWEDYRLRVVLRSDTDQGVGVVFRYQDDQNFYRLSLHSALGYRRLIKVSAGTVTTLWEDTTAYPVGDDITVTVDAIGAHLVGYQGTTRLFALTDTPTDTSLVKGRIGVYSWANSRVQFAHVEVRRPPLDAYALLVDRFAAGDTTGWIFVSEGTAAGPPVWSTEAGALRQTSEIFSPPIDRDTLSKRGTNAVAGDPRWTDVIFRARVQSFDDDAVGLLLRYQDAMHYYRFSMDRQRGYRRLVKNVGGIFTLLWEDATA